MYFVKAEQTDFSVVIKSRGKLPTPWKWEIYRAPGVQAQSPNLLSFLRQRVPPKGRETELLLKRWKSFAFCEITVLDGDRG
jgi:hypothetical protein